MSSANSRQEPGISWNKVITLCSAFGIPLAGVLFWLIVSGTKLVDKVNAISDKQDKMEVRQDRIEIKFNEVIHRLDTMTTTKYSIKLFTEKYVNGRLIFVPVK